MPITLAEVIEQVRNDLDEVTPTHWTDAQLTQWVNDGLKDLARNTFYHQVEDDFAYAAEEVQVDGPTNIIRAHRAEFLPDDDETRAYPISLVEPRIIDQYRGPGSFDVGFQPALLSAWGLPPNMKLKLYPRPSTTGSVRLTYFAYPTEAVEPEDVLELPEGWHDAVVFYAQYRALRQDRSTQLWQEAKGVYQETVAGLNALTDSWSDNTGMIVSPYGMVPSYLYD